MTHRRVELEVPLLFSLRLIIYHFLRLRSAHLDGSGWGVAVVVPAMAAAVVRRFFGGSGRCQQWARSIGTLM